MTGANSRQIMSPGRLIAVLVVFLEIAAAVTAHSTVQFSLTKSTYAGNENIVANWTRTPGDQKSATDWIGIYTPGQTPGPDPSLRWLYLNGTQSAPAQAVQSGGITFVNPGLAPGSYIAHLFSNDGYSDLTTAVSFTVTAQGGPAPPVFVLSDFLLRYGIVGTTYSGKISAFAKDPDPSDTISYSKVSGPSWLGVNSDGIIGGTPGNQDIGVNLFVIRATDLQNHSSTATLTLNIFTPGSAHVDRLRVLTFNLWVGWQNVTNGQRKGIEAILLSGADIVCIQEASAGSGTFQPQEVANALGWYFARIPGGTDLGVVSRYPIVATYPVTNANAVGARFRLCDNPLQEIIAYSEHFDYLHYGPYEAKRSGSTNQSVMTEELASQRDEQATALVSAMQQQLTNADQVPVILCGDFNCPSHQDWTSASASLHYGKVIAWPVTTILTNAGLVDSFRQAHPDPVAVPGNTWSSIYVGSAEPQDRIDFIFSKGRNLKVATSAVFNTAVETTLNQYGDPIGPINNNTWPTDHRSVVTEFRVLPEDSDGDGLADYWENLQFGSTSGQGAADDPDYDGMSNLLERAFGSSPADGLSQFPPQIQSDGYGHINFAYNRLRDGSAEGSSYASGGVRYEVERSDNLQSWVPANDWLTPDGPAIPVGIEWERVNFRLSAPNENQRLFFRLTVTPE